MDSILALVFGLITYVSFSNSTMLAFAIVIYSFLTYNFIVSELNTYCLCDNIIHHYIHAIEVLPFCDSYCTYQLSTMK
jgi:hypothetical protein